MIKEATELGALMHFTKPFDIDELRMAVNMQLQDGADSFASDLTSSRWLIRGGTDSSLYHSNFRL